MELSSHIDLVFDQGYLSEEKKSLIDEKMVALLKLIQGYIKYLKQSKRDCNEPGVKGIAEMTEEYLIDYEASEE